MAIKNLIKWAERIYFKLFSQPEVILRKTLTKERHPGRGVLLGGDEVKIFR
jgi:hypothetical protein